MTPSLGTLRSIIAGGLCHRCGSCSGICPGDVITPDEEYYPSWEGRMEKCTDCGLCVRVCPGTSFSFPEFSERVFDIRARGSDAHGTIRGAFLGYAGDPAVRAASTSGGVATQLSIYLLSAGRCRGAFTVVPDGASPWKPRAIVARSREDLLAGAMSKYPACSMNHLFRDLTEDAGPFVLTGLPCHVHGARKLACLDPRIERKLALIVGIFCHSCLDHQALRDIFDSYRIRQEDIAQVEYRGGKLPGYIRVLTKKGEWAYLPYPHLGPDRYRPDAKECLNLFFRLYSPPRCRLCIDATSEFADISIGDPWFKGWQGIGKLRGGYSFILARTERGLALLREAEQAGAIALETYPLEKARASHEPMPGDKQRRGLYNSGRRLRKGLRSPDYGFTGRFTMPARIRQAILSSTYFFADRPGCRRALVAALLSRGGRLLVGLLFLRRRILRAMRSGSRREQQF